MRAKKRALQREDGHDRRACNARTTRRRNVSGATRGRLEMTKKRSGDRDDPRPESGRAVSRRDSSRREPPPGSARAPCWRRTLPGGRTSAANPDDIAWDYEVDVVVAGAGCAGLTAAIRARDLGASVLVVDAELRRRRPDAAQRVVRLPRGRRPGSAAGQEGRERQGRADHRRSRRGAGGARRQRRAPVHGPHRLVGRRPQGPEPVPLQRARARPRVGRERPGDAAVPHRQLRPVHARHQHPRRRRPVSRARGALLPHARRQDRHQGGHDHGGGRGGRRSRAHERASRRSR